MQQLELFLEATSKAEPPMAVQEAPPVAADAALAEIEDEDGAQALEPGRPSGRRTALPKSGIAIGPRDVEFLATPLQDVDLGDWFVAGTAAQRAAILCRVVGADGEVIDAVGRNDTRLRFCAETGVLMRASIGRQHWDSETVVNSGIRIRATGETVRSKLGLKRVDAILLALQAEMPPLPAGSELAPYRVPEPMGPGGMRC